MSGTLNSTTSEQCLFCQTISNHRKELKSIVEKASQNMPQIDVPKLRSTPICSIKIPSGQKPMSIDDIEKRYTLNHPTWETTCQSFPESPIFNGKGKLLNGNLFTRAIDIEEKKQSLIKKLKELSNIPFDKDCKTDNQIVEKITNYIVESLQIVISDLNLASNPRIKNGLQKALSGKIKGKLHDLKDSDKAMDALLEVQYEAFDMVLENDKNFKVYEMR